MPSGNIDSEFELKRNLFLFTLFGSLAFAVYLFYPDRQELPPSPTYQLMINIVQDIATNSNTVLNKDSCIMIGKNARFYSCKIVSYSEQELLQYLNNSHWQYVSNQSSKHNDLNYFWNGRFKLYLEKGDRNTIMITDKNEHA